MEKERTVGDVGRLSLGPLASYIGSSTAHADASADCKPGEISDVADCRSTCNKNRRMSETLIIGKLLRRFSRVTFGTERTTKLSERNGSQIRSKCLIHGALACLGSLRSCIQASQPRSPSVHSMHAVEVRLTMKLGSMQMSGSKRAQHVCSSWNVDIEA